MKEVTTKLPAGKIAEINDLIRKGINSVRNILINQPLVVESATRYQLFKL